MEQVQKQGEKEIEISQKHPGCESGDSYHTSRDAERNAGGVAGGVLR